jgi:hypothetical protein
VAALLARKLDRLQPLRLLRNRNDFLTGRTTPLLARVGFGGAHDAVALAASKLDHAAFSQEDERGAADETGSR